MDILTNRFKAALNARASSRSACGAASPARSPPRSWPAPASTGCSSTWSTPPTTCATSTPRSKSMMEGPRQRDGADAERRADRHQAHPRHRRAVANDPEHRRCRPGQPRGRGDPLRPARACAASRRRPAPPASAASRTITPAARRRSSWRSRSNRAAPWTTWRRSPASRASTASSSDPATSPPASAILGQQNHPDVVKRSSRRRLPASRRTGKHAGILTANEELAHRYIEAGTRFTAVGSDMGLLARHLRGARRPLQGLSLDRPSPQREGERTRRASPGDTTMNVGFVGLGIMGAPMAGHLIGGGHSLVPQDPPGRCRRVLDRGGWHVPAPPPPRWRSARRRHHPDAARYAGRRGRAVRRRRRRGGRPKRGAGRWST